MEPNEAPMDVYEFEIDRFQTLLKEDRTYAFDRYGFTLLYSLPPEDTFALLQEFGWNSEDPLDFYNQGTVECHNQQFDEAKKHFKQAESLGCEQPELFFNMALIHENEENEALAREYYQNYIDAIEKWDDIPKGLQKELDEVREHLKTLGT